MPSVDWERLADRLETAGDRLEVLIAEAERRIDAEEQAADPRAEARADRRR